MIRGCTITILVIILFVVGLAVGAKWLIADAFGSKHRTIEVKLDDNRTLICEEIYNADFAAVFYDVKFTLNDKNKESIELGRTTFSKENWDENLKLTEIGDWIIFPVTEGSYSKMLLTNINSKICKDTTFSPLELRYDSLWRLKHEEIPAWVYSGKSELDSIVENKIYINYKYRLGINKPFEFYNQMVEYEMDLTTGNFMTKTIFQRKK